MTTKRILAGIGFALFNKEAAIMRSQCLNVLINCGDEDDPAFQKGKATLQMIESFCDELADVMKGENHDG